MYFSPQLEVSKLYTVCSSDASTRKNLLAVRTASSLRAEPRMQTGGGKYPRETFLNNIYKVQIRPKMCCGRNPTQTSALQWSEHRDLERRKDSRLIQARIAKMQSLGTPTA